MTRDDSRNRLGLLAVAAVSLFGALFARLWFLQVVEGSSLDAQANRNAARTAVIPAPRGRILDRNGLVLVDSRESIVVTVDWQDYIDMAAAKQTAVLKRLSAALTRGRPNEPVTVKFLRSRLADSRFTHLRPVPVAEDVTEDQEVLLREQAADYPTVDVERRTVRQYPYGSLAAHVLGYVGPLTDGQWKLLSKFNDRDKPYVETDDIGRAGVESTYESYLRGTPGRRVYEVDRRNRVVGELTSQRVEPSAGNDLYLSIDARVQGEAEKALRQGLDERRGAEGELGNYPAEAGATAVVDPVDGQVLAMASYPTYDPSTLVGGISCPEWRDLQGLPAQGSCGNLEKELRALPSGDRPVSKLVNRALAGTYPPGSTFKLASAFVGTKLGLLTPDTTLNDPGYFDTPGCKRSPADDCRRFSPAAENPGGLGTVNLAGALTASSDTYFYKLGNDTWALHKQKGLVGPTAFQDEAAKLGFGATSGIDLPNESAGRLPDPAWLKRFDVQVNGTETDGGRWGAGSSINLAIGQGDMLVTPLQMANAYAAFANAGTLYQPSVLNRITEANQPDRIVRASKPKAIRSVDWGPSRLALVDGFAGVTKDRPHATAKGAFEGFPQDRWPVSGKTGTAQSGTDSQPREDHSWFVGFGPEGGARYSAAVVMEHSGQGGLAAAPAVRRILEPIALNQLDLIDLRSLADPAALGALKPPVVPASIAPGPPAPGAGTTSTSVPAGTVPAGTAPAGTGTPAPGTAAVGPRPGTRQEGGA